MDASIGEVMHVKTVEIYTTATGREPVTEWLACLKDKGVRVRIEDRLVQVEEGHFGDYASIGEGVFEMRLFFGPGFRIYFAQYKAYVVVLLCGGDKNTQTRDIKKAKEILEGF